MLFLKNLEGLNLNLGRLNLNLGHLVPKLFLHGGCTHEYASCESGEWHVQKSILSLKKIW